MVEIMDWQELENIIKCEKRETTYVEAMELGGVILPLIKIKGYDLYLQGMGEDFDSILLYLRSNDMEVKGIISLDENRGGKYAGIPVFTMDELEKENINNAFVVITDPFFFDIKKLRETQIIQRAIRKFIRERKRKAVKSALKQYGVFRFYFISSNDRRDIYSDYYKGRMHYYKEHLNDLRQTYDMLCDRSSKKILLEYIRVYLQSGWYRLEESDGRNKYFAGSGRGTAMECLYEHKEDEVWVNCGSSIGDTILLYFSEGYRASKVYAFEGSRRIYKRLCENIDQLTDELKQTVVPVNEYISEGTDWSQLIRERITLINADIEGSELSLLHTMKEKIKQDRPVLAICVYHRNEDLVEIPRFIKRITDGYKYLLRKYSCSVCNDMRTSELVMYAIPDERYSFTD